MKITDVKTYIVGNPWKNWVFSRVETDEGIHGISESTLNSFAKTIEAGIQELKPRIVGLDPFHVEEILLRLTRDVSADGGQIHMNAVAAIEIACWDIMGKAVGKPSYELLGGKVNDRIRVYANGWYRGERTPKLFHERAKEVVLRGYTALKFDPFGSAWRQTDPGDKDMAVDIVAAVRDAVGPNVDILIEGHWRFNVSSAVEFAHRLAPYNPTWFEEPTPSSRIQDCAEVGRRIPFPVATGENLTSKQQFAELMELDAVHIVQPEIQCVGGLLTAKQICGIVDAHYGVVAPHSAGGPVGTAICMTLAACTPNFFIQELFDEFNDPWTADIVDHPYTQKDGWVEVSDRPGLGLDLVLEECAKHPYHPGGFLPLFMNGWEKRFTQELEES